MIASNRCTFVALAALTLLGCETASSQSESSEEFDPSGDGGADGMVSGPGGSGAGGSPTLPPQTKSCADGPRPIAQESCAHGAGEWVLPCPEDADTERYCRLLRPYRVSVSSEARQGELGSAWNGPLAVSADGRFVAFASQSSNLVPESTFGANNCFVHDVWLGTTTLVSQFSAEDTLGTIFSIQVADDGQLVAFATDVDLLPSLNPESPIRGYLWDATSKMLRDAIVSGRNPTNAAADVGPVQGLGRILSGERYITFSARSDNYNQHFIYDLMNSNSYKLNVSSEGEGTDQGAASTSVSDDGRFAVFTSAATNLSEAHDPDGFDVFLHDRTTKQTSLISARVFDEDTACDAGRGSITRDGRYIAYSSKCVHIDGDTEDGLRDVFLHDRMSGITTRITPDDKEGDAFNGQFHNWNGEPMLRFLVGTEQFMYSLNDQTIHRVEGPGLSRTNYGWFAYEAAVVVFSSEDADIVPDDTNDSPDVFLAPLTLR